MSRIDPRSGSRHCRFGSRSPLLSTLAALALGSGLAGGLDAQASETEPATTRLGRALFVDQRFTDPAADYHASCAGCHALGSSVGDRTARFYADYTPLSLTAAKQTTLRNTPGLLDLARWSRYGHDGRYESLETMIETKLTGPFMGWQDGDRTRPRDAIQFTLLEEGSENGERYLALFREAYDVDLEMVDGDEALRWTARALAGFVRSIETTETAAWDAFRTQNRISAGPSGNEPPKSYAGGVEGRLGNLEGRLQIKRPEGFTQEAYQGFRTFFRTFGEQSVGNCVSCHVPPHFTDFKFHNTGIAQAEYDGIHGAGAFAKLAIEAGQRGTAERLSRPDAERPALVDLGYWNFAAAEAVPGSFKTPSLRNLGHTDPYMHNGAYATLTDAVTEIVRINRLARAGELRDIDPEYQAMHLSDADVVPLVAFLRQLDEVGEEGFRYYLIHFEED